MNKPGEIFDNHGVTCVTQKIAQNGPVANADVIEYEFVNFSNVPVTINGMFLERYYAGARTNPTYINSNNCNRWKPNLKSGERDTGVYNVQFITSLYPGISAAAVDRNLIAIKKIFSPVSVKSQGR